MPPRAPFPGPLFDALSDAAASAAFEHGARVVTRGELLVLIGRLQHALREVGLGAGSTLAIFTSISPESFAAQLAAHALGCRVIGVRQGYTPRQLAHVLAPNVDALLLDSSSGDAASIRAVAQLRRLSLGPLPGAIDLLARAGPRPDPTLGVRADDVTALYFTSGSTGLPKGCAYTSRALGEHWSWQGSERWSPIAAEFAGAFERYLLYGTLASLVVMEFLAPCLLGGGTAVIPIPDERPLFPHALERYRITGAIVTVPRLSQMLEELAKAGLRLERLRALMVSGSPLAASRLAAALDRLGPVVYQGYGQTEAGSISMLTPADAARLPGALASVGRPHPGVEVSVRDESNRPLPAGRIGEVLVRSPYQMAGYPGAPEETRDVLRDGRLRTQDLGFLDDEGLLHLVGRSRDVVMVNAMVVYAGPIERVLGTHADVAQAYVVGAPDERTGEAVHAFIVPAAGGAPDAAALRALVRAELGDDSVPASITEIANVPVLQSGKPDKRALFDHYDAARP